MSELNSALIGSSGFVGSVLQRQANFSSHYRSTNISNIDGEVFESVVCAAAPAQKWMANRDPLGDEKNIQALISHLKSVRCDNFILISTVDVFKDPIDVDENTFVSEMGLQAYGLNRRNLEKFVQEWFPNHLIVRLPGLVGPGLRKNVIFDFLNHNNVQSIDSRGVFQFYPMVNLWWDIQIALNAKLKLVHLTAEPISVKDVSVLGFGEHFDQTQTNPAARYDFRTIHAAAFGGKGVYQYSARESIQAIRAYAQSEPRTLIDTKGHNL